MAIINLDEYRRIQRFRREREAFFEWLESTAARNAERYLLNKPGNVGQIANLSYVSTPEY